MLLRSQNTTNTKVRLPQPRPESTLVNALGIQGRTWNGQRMRQDPDS